MSLFDIFLVGGAVVWLLFGARRGRLALAPPLILAAVALLQMMVEGFTWQLLPAYLLVPLCTLLFWTARSEPTRLRRWIGGLGRLTAAMIVVGPWLLFLPAPTLAKPGGPYALGSQTFRFVDTSRPESATTDPADSRNVIVQAWYPAAPGARGPHTAYIDGLGRLPAMVSVLPGFIMRQYGRIDTHAMAGASISPARQWPVVLFSPGYGAPRAGYTGLITELASRGYVVLAVDHPYESAVVELANGRIASNVQPSGNLRAYMVRQQDIRAEDLRFVLDQLARNAFGIELSAHLDLGRIAAVGHSFGGPSTVLAMTRDARIRAAANIDGTPYGDLPDQRLDRPFLLIESDYAETPHDDIYITGNAKLLANDSAPTERLVLHHANHYSFTDMPLFFSPPARWAVTVVAGGSVGPVATQRKTADILAKFLTRSMP